MVSGEKGQPLIFNTLWYWYFLLVTVGLLGLMPKAIHVKIKYPLVLAACLVFHFHFAGPAGMSVVLALGAVVFLVARFSFKKSTSAILFTTLICVGALGYFKYRALIGSWLGQDWTIAAIPLGISFFTFEYVHYLYEVRQGGKPIQSPLEFGLFAVFFPSLVAGPIKRYSQFQQQIKKASAFRPDIESLLSGGTRIVFGASKKILLADPLAQLSDDLYKQFLSQGLDVGRSWLFLMAITFRIYFDFSGYSDVAIGTAQVLKIELPENFNWPYAARSLQEFWRRWHISLSSWIRDYVYIPLGGARVAQSRRFFNLVFAFGVCGLWHGAEEHFIIWGLWHGAGLALERVLFESRFGKNFFAGAGGWLATFLFVSLGWLLFFYPVEQAFKMGLGLIGANV